MKTVGRIHLKSKPRWTRACP